MTMKLYFQRREVRWLGVKSGSFFSVWESLASPRKNVYFWEPCILAVMYGGISSVFLSALHKSRYTGLDTNRCRNRKTCVAFTLSLVADLHIERRALSVRQMSFFCLCKNCS